MSRIKKSQAREMSDEDLEERIQELRSELLKHRPMSNSGTLRKDSGKIKPLKRDIARMLTVLRERKK